ncbi:hypothetical protein QR680_001119 [Steinernema hermaphroditum]|uniref:Probable glycerol kinase n=1 Tax=Steinernema hermaphroditum TaxID=289476 RepID=A0AA39LFG5_9BILA|nr:hypothetical protein QR680_001119 [Steinernema hermaphroditum]
MVLLGAIDQGTSSSRFLVFEADTGELVVSHQIEVRQLFPEAGWVEMDAMELYNTVVECIEKACEELESIGIGMEEVKAIGIANQRETAVAWDKVTGRPLCHAIVWLDTRTSELAQEYIDKTPTKNKDYFKAKTGLPIHPYFSALKFRWMLNNVDAVQEAYRNGTLMFGTVDTWLIWKLTGVYATDVTNASRTLLLDLHKRKWSSQLCDFFDLPLEVFPDILSSAEVFGYIKSGPMRGTAISGCLGDQQAALVGHSCLSVGDTKSTYGTGTFMLCNIGTKPVLSKTGLLTTVGFQFGSAAPMCYAFEGSGSIGGNVVRFLRDNLGLIKDAKEIEELARGVEDTAGVYFVPCFTGLYTPYWDPTARGTICGLTQYSSKAHLARAALKAVAFQTAEMLDAVEHDMDNLKITTLKIDGGMSANQLFNQMQSDTIGRAIVCSTMPEISGWGAAVAAGIGAQIISLDQFTQHSSPSLLHYSPQLSEKERSEEMTSWKKAVARALKWASDE